MANNDALDSQLLIAAQQAYLVTDTGLYNGVPPAGYVVDEAFIQANRVHESGLKLIVFKNETTGDRIISFAGTESSTKDWYSNGQLGANQWAFARPPIQGTYQ